MSIDSSPPLKFQLSRPSHNAPLQPRAGSKKQASNRWLATCIQKAFKQQTGSSFLVLRSFYLLLEDLLMIGDETFDTSRGTTPFSAILDANGRFYVIYWLRLRMCCIEERLGDVVGDGRIGRCCEGRRLRRWWAVRWRLTNLLRSSVTLWQSLWTGWSGGVVAGSRWWSGLWEW